MRIIDTHIHFYNLNNNINTWIKNAIDSPYLQVNHLPQMLLDSSKNEIYGVLHVEAHDSAIPTEVEIKWLEQAMQATPKLRYKHIAFVDITLSITDFITIINQIKTYKYVVGIRHILSYQPDFRYNPCDSDLSKNKNILENLKYLAKNNLIFACQAYPYQIKNLLPLIYASKVSCIVDHFALPGWHVKNDENHKLWQSTVLELAKSPNIFLKMSGLDMLQPKSEFAEIIDYILNNFPIARLLYGSNNPVSNQGDYNTWGHDLLEHFKHLNPKTCDDIFYNNAYKLLFDSEG